MLLRASLLQHDFMVTKPPKPITAVAELYSAEAVLQRRWETAALWTLDHIRRNNKRNAGRMLGGCAQVPTAEPRQRRTRKHLCV
eukprot:8945098-Pyramimonas_sp.AAC.1